jgi:hypothetical protein
MNDLYTETDFIYLKEIIRRPFVNPSSPDNKKISFREILLTNKSNTKSSSSKGGTKKKTRKYRRKTVRRR